MSLIRLLSNAVRRSLVLLTCKSDVISVGPRIRIIT